MKLKCDQCGEDYDINEISVIENGNKYCQECIYKIVKGIEKLKT